MVGARHRRDDPAAAAYAEAGADCLYAPASTPSSRSPRSSRPWPQAGEPADQRAVHHRRGGGRTRRAPDQRRGHAGANGLGGFLTAAQEIAGRGDFARFEELPNVDALFSDGR